MPISSNVPGHLINGAQAHFLNAVRVTAPSWQRVAAPMSLDGNSQLLVDLGSPPMPVNSKTGFTIQDMIEKSLTVTPESWNVGISISYNAIADDRTGSLETKARQAGNNFAKHINKIVFQALNAGDGSTYGLCYDGNEFFDASHIDSGAHYQTAQSNLGTAALSRTAFYAAIAAMRKFRDDQGEFTEFMPDLLVVDVDGADVGFNLVNNERQYDTGNAALNPYTAMDDMSIAWMDTDSWALLCTKEIVKPMIVVLREDPHLQAAWFDPEGPDGGSYIFKFYARYNVAYGDWRLAYLGKT